MSAALRIFILAASILSAHMALAQEAMPQTPPELKDFRLDPEKTKPQETQPQETLPKPPVIELPEVRTTDPTPQPKPAQSQKAPVRSPAPAPLNVTPKAAPQSSAETTPPLTQETQAPLPQADATPPVSKRNTGVDFAGVNWWLIASGVAVAAITLFGFGAWMRRRKVLAAEHYAAEPPVAFDPVGEAAHRRGHEPEAIVEPVLIKPAKSPPVVANRATLDISFVPGKAIISLANLTINGELRIINQGTAAAQNMRLRAAVISASEMHNDVIASFHTNRDTAFTEDIGEAGPEERIGMQIEISIPLTELRSYPVGDQQLFVPIVLANIEYNWGKGKHDEARLAALIGREATPPKPKMGPLRLDLGPRSFTPLGQRPVFG